MIEGHLIVIGAMKAGTTTLHELLAEHPDLVCGCVKELDHFGGSAWAGPESYDARFPEASATGRRPVVTLDASPSYAKRAERSPAPSRIAQLRRPVHLVYVLRDPVARAVSHVRHNIGRLRVEAGDLGRLDLQRYAMASRYSRQIEAYEAVGLRDRLLLLDFETLCRDPAATLRLVCRHAGLAPPLDVETRVHANRSPLPDEVVEGLDITALRRALKGERGCMIERHGFAPARGWPDLRAGPEARTAEDLTARTA